MKKISCLLLSIFTASLLYAQTENLVHLNAPIVGVRVYLSGAEIQHSSDVNLKKGMNRVVFDNLTAELRGKSALVNLAASAGKHVEMLSLTSAADFLQSEKSEPRILRLRDSLQILEDSITSLNNQVDAWREAKNMLIKNQDVANPLSANLTGDLQKLMDFFHDKTWQSDKMISILTKKIVDAMGRKTLVNNQLLELNDAVHPKRMQVIATLKADMDITTEINLRYITYKTGWQPSYDIKVKDISQPVELKYKARVYNNTGIDWKNIPLTLSTADPSQSASRPYLTTWALNYSGFELQDDFDNNKGVEFGKMNERDRFSGDTSVNFVPVAMDELSVEFQIEKPYDIPADAKPYTVDITTATLPADYRYVAVPKMDCDAFLLARVTGWEKLNLVDGPANIYFGDSYVGESDINTRSVEDTLELSIGRDNQVLVTRSKKEDFTGKKLIGTNKTEQFSYEMVVKNNHDSPITMQLEDQVPVSQASDITVDVNETSGATPDLITGKLEWEFTLKPGESKTVKLSFSVKYPRNKQVNTKKSRMLYAPRW